MPGSARARSSRLPWPPRSARLHGLALDVEADALALDRGARSGLGTGLFLQGGLALDGGRGPADRPAPIIARLPFPEDWHVLLILDPARQGVHGPEEIAAFKSLPEFPGGARRASLPARAHAGAAGRRRARPCKLRPRGHRDPDARRRLFRRGAGRTLRQPGCRRRPRRCSPRTASKAMARAPGGRPDLPSPRRARRRAGCRTSPLRSLPQKGLELQIVKGRNSGAAIGEMAAGRQEGSAAWLSLTSCT